MKQKTIETRQNFYWHFIDVYLDLLSQIHFIREDEVFYGMIGEMKSYIDKKLALDNDSDIIDTYVTVLQESDE